VKCQVF